MSDFYLLEYGREQHIYDLICERNSSESSMKITYKDNNCGDNTNNAKIK